MTFRTPAVLVPCSHLGAGHEHRRGKWPPRRRGRRQAASPGSSRGDGERLTLGELANLWVDEPVAPFHIALIGEFDATPFLREDGGVDAGRICDEVIRRARRVPALRRRIVPSHRSRPRWADDPDFDPARHVSWAELPAGRRLAEWCGRRTGRPFPPGRPPWRIEVITGSAPGRFGLMIVLHHVLTDGLGGVALAGALLDGSPSGALLDTSPSGARSAAADSGASRVPRQDHKAGLDRPVGLRARLRQRSRQLADAATDLRIRAPVTSLSGPIGFQRRLTTVALPLDDLRRAGHALGVTVNDLLLAGVTGGLRDLLVARGEEITGLELRASAPVGARRPGQADGILMLGLPVGEPDPLRRLAAISRTTARLKHRLQSGGGDALDVLSLPTPLARLAVRWMRRVAGRGINLFVTNVPGPATPLELAGARLLTAVPVASLVRGIPLGIAALSYCGTLNVSVDADSAVHDVDVLAAGIERGVAQLLRAARSGARLPAVVPPSLVEAVGASAVQSTAGNGRVHGRRGG